MYIRVVDVTSKQGKARELCHTLEDKVLPILKKQHGFVDEFVMVSDAEPDRIVAESIWKTRDDARRYQQEQFDAVQKIMQPLLENPPVVRTFDIHISTAHRITTAKAEKAA